MKSLEERKKKIKADLESKLEKSEEKRTKKNKEKMESLKNERRYRN